MRPGCSWGGGRGSCGPDLVDSVIPTVRMPVVHEAGPALRGPACGGSSRRHSRSSRRWVNPSVGDSAETDGRRTCSAGEWSSRPSMTQVR
jgi:hypothetical protein